ncbi:hypothetical protein CSUB01_10427 [Colletotrichum sublineola]|uniref:Uncharacterized protein n=1 Tax=Colletotrichum sublineola TaxID=1173701 RepID=A0A066XH54_COLSU|nr:hypothetical protein CSUB01_10427 [Colletotrichum sublineola]
MLLEVGQNRPDCSPDESQLHHKPGRVRGPKPFIYTKRPGRNLNALSPGLISNQHNHESGFPSNPTSLRPHNALISAHSLLFWWWPPEHGAHAQPVRLDLSQQDPAAEPLRPVSRDEASSPLRMVYNGLSHIATSLSSPPKRRAASASARARPRLR